MSGSSDWWRTREVQRHAPEWKTYVTADLLSARDAELLQRVANEPTHTQSTFVLERGADFAAAFLHALRDIIQDNVVLYVLTLLDELFKDQPRVAGIFSAVREEEARPFGVVTKLLHRQEDLTVARACNVTSALLIAGTRLSEREGEVLLDWVLDRLGRGGASTDRQLFQSVLSLAQGLLRSPVHRVHFFRRNGINTLFALLQQGQHVQTMYQAAHCVWLLSYEPGVAKQMATDALTRHMSAVLKQEVKEKVTRMVLSVLLNMVKIGDMQSSMVDYGLLKTLKNLQTRVWGDEDVAADIEELSTVLEATVQTKSTFDEYRKEVLTGDLDWTPVHKSQSFWENNWAKFADKDNLILRNLLQVLKPGERPNARAVAVACHDLGQFVRIHPHGKSILSNLGGKKDIMHHMTSQDEEVRKEALLCVQKLMVH